MGVYIPTAEMPHNLLECFYGEQCQEYEDCNGLERGKKCPLIELDLVRCRECKYSKNWYGDHRLCYLWAETGIGVFEDGYCSHGERRSK